MTREQAIRKVLACLRLASSSNPTEAATALRQARALMDKYGLTEDDALAAEIHDLDAKTGFRGGDLPKSLLWLANMVASGYRCSVVVVRERHWQGGKTALRFFGAGADAQIAVYAFTVLRRQLDTDRRRHIARVRKAANRQVRGEEFAQGWVHAVARLFPADALPEGRAKALDAAISTRLGPVEAAEGRKLAKSGQRDPGDKSAGYWAGKRAELNQGLSEGQKKLESGHA
ncbi:DUF2786 domain-containing protein [Pseudoxanthomonas winnipegensis]|uniref:DUF2786 domain-containing protein n=1 Tax=Pseudoxanthomonas winnipegensis TaxID=2480810 RepID=UPI00102DF16C|nr:DUF2786 domain-containing protein [Pseudoxanthomonas winnipegensis]TAA42919.1 DUF2786 domain-containing protein [Pseudoxanthomonas winnipegensis]